MMEAVAVEDVKLKFAGLKLQLVFGGRNEHVEDESVVDPVNPF
jgi:hypothetical protein